ncbi:hypothetical protein BN135_511 [Cronobacter muytjensii 530]|nr:hypothetical protein BN133_1146 [Cronobacter dublinensis 582]
MHVIWGVINYLNYVDSFFEFLFRVVFILIIEFFVNDLKAVEN